MLKEFREFVKRGNVIDLAVGVIIGGAFGKIVTSLVNDILMPPIGLLLGNANFADFFISLDGKDYASLAAAKAAGAPTVNYGVFINTTLDFLIVAFTIFIVVKQVNRIRKKWDKPEPAKAPTTKSCPECLSDIPIAASRCKFCTTLLHATQSNGSDENPSGPAVNIR